MRRSNGGRLLLWEQGERSRALMVNRPCFCGCDARLGVPGVGYLSGSDAAGNGFTLWIDDEATYARLAAMIAGHHTVGNEPNQKSDTFTAA